MSKFKVLVDGASGADVIAGDIVTLWRDDGSEMKAYYQQSGSYWWIHDRYLEPIRPRTLTVGETYTIGSGRKMRVIYIEGGVAFGVFLNPEGVPSLNSAYTWDMNGVYRNAVDAEKPQYNVKFEPVVEWVDTRFSVATRNTSKKDGCDYHVACIRFPLIDGKPDWSQATVTEA